MTEALLAGLLAGYAVALPLGAIGSYLVTLGSQERYAVAAAGALGVATTDGLYALAAAFAGAAIAAALRPVRGALTTVAVVVIVMLAVHTLLAAGPRASTRTRRRPRSPAATYVLLLALTAVNPTTVLYFAALVAGGTAVTATTAGVFAVAVFAASASWQLALTTGGSLLRDRGRTVQVVVAAVSAAIMLVSAVRLLLS